MEFIIHSLFYKALSNKDNEIKKQLEAFTKIINEAHQLHPIFSNLHINNAINPSKPLGYSFPSDEALNYFYKARKKILLNQHFYGMEKMTALNI